MPWFQPLQSSPKHIPSIRFCSFLQYIFPTIYSGDWIPNSKGHSLHSERLNCQPHFGRSHIYSFLPSFCLPHQLLDLAWPELIFFGCTLDCWRQELWEESIQTPSKPCCRTSRVSSYQASSNFHFSSSDISDFLFPKILHTSHSPTKTKYLAHKEVPNK